MPANVIYVGRPSKWGNPFNWSDYVDHWHDDKAARQLAVDLFRDWLAGKVKQWQINRDRVLSSLDELRGFDLACWCPLDEPCHADVLLELANS